MEPNQKIDQQRLDNIKAIKPMLASLRTISLSNWKLALKRLQFLTSHQQEINAALETISLTDIHPEVNAFQQEESAILILGSTRGLCGSFNRDLVKFLNNNLSQESKSSSKFVLFGERLKTTFSREKLDYAAYFEYPKINTLNFSYIARLSAQLDKITPSLNLFILYNDYLGAGKFKTIMQDLSSSFRNPTPTRQDTADIIIDSDISEIAVYYRKLSRLISLYKAFLASLASEHSSRFQIMENALSNTDDLIQELTIMLQVERRKKITSEMNELSISAGLLKQA